MSLRRAKRLPPTTLAFNWPFRRDSLKTIFSEKFFWPNLIKPDSKTMKNGFWTAFCESNCLETYLLSQEATPISQKTIVFEGTSKKWSNNKQTLQYTDLPHN